DWLRTAFMIARGRPPGGQGGPGPPIARSVPGGGGASPISDLRVTIGEHAVPAGALGRVERLIRRAQEIAGGRDDVLGQRGHADAGGDGVPVGEGMGGQYVPDAVRV